MSVQSDLLVVLAGVGGVLVVASAIGWVLGRKLSPDGRNEAIENLNDRIRAWWVMVLALGLAFLGARPAFCCCLPSARLPRCANS